VNLRLALAALHVPEHERRRGLLELVERTARAFEVEAPDLAGADDDEVLRRYARFTRQEAGRVAQSREAVARARERLRREGAALGSALRGRLAVASRAEAMRAARVLYRMLGIDLKASLAGSVVVRSCSFSSTYTCGTCVVMGALDEGLFSGLVGEGRLEFAARITEGAPRCVAFFAFEGARK
jgi:hypothetical protein